MTQFEIKDKPLALLIPGLDGTGLLYYRQVDGLAVRHRVLPWAFRPRASFVYDDLIEELGRATSGEKPGSIVVVGESFGGTIAMHYALTYPERISRLVLINTFARYRNRLRIRLACRLAPLLHFAWVRAIKDFITEQMLAREGVPLECRRRYYEIIQLVDRAAYQRRLELVRDVSLVERLQEIAIPTLVFASGRDKIVPSRREARLMASRIPNARLYEFPRAGHALLLTAGFSLADYL